MSRASEMQVCDHGILSKMAALLVVVERTGEVHRDELVTATRTAVLLARRTAHNAIDPRAINVLSMTLMPAARSLHRIFFVASRSPVTDRKQQWVEICLLVILVVLALSVAIPLIFP